MDFYVMTPWDFFMLLCGFAIGIAVTTITYVTIWESRTRYVPRARTRYRYGRLRRVWD